MGAREQGIWQRMTSGQEIDYDAMAQEAMRGVVRALLVRIAKSGLPGEHHFYIAFDTNAPGVSLSRRLKEKYPDEMTIVLQHRFWDLAVTDERFEVKLTFDGIPERLVVPFASLRVFYDPSVRYTLHFEDLSAPDDAAEPQQGRRARQAASAGDNAGERSRRPRSRQKARTDKSADAAAPAPETPAALQLPSAQSEPKAAPPPVEAPAAEKSGAQIVSLDAFRKK